MAGAEKNGAGPAFIQRLFQGFLPGFPRYEVPCIEKWLYADTCKAVR